jgi:hypothetical protein
MCQARSGEKPPSPARTGKRLTRVTTSDICEKHAMAGLDLRQPESTRRTWSKGHPGLVTQLPSGLTVTTSETRTPSVKSMMYLHVGVSTRWPRSLALLGRDSWH